MLSLLGWYLLSPLPRADPNSGGASGVLVDADRPLREWAMTVPEIVHLTVATPYPGTEIWLTETRRLTSRDYRLFDVAHAVLPTRMPLDKFYAELVKTQEILNRKHLGWGAIPKYGLPAVRALMRGQTNYVKMLWKFARVVNQNRQYADHQRPVKYEMRPPKPAVAKPNPAGLFVHVPQGLRAKASTPAAG